MSLPERSDAPFRPLPVKWLALTVALMVIVCISGYLLSPKWQAVRDEQRRLADPLHEFAETSTPEAQLLALQNQIRTNPQDSEKWALLGEYYL